MKLLHWLPLGLVCAGIILDFQVAPQVAGAIAPLAQSSSSKDCPVPVLSRLKRHTITSGETLDSIAQRYNLIPATLMGMNPQLRNGNIPVGAEILVPPYNGIRVELRQNQTLTELAKAYRVRADVLFELNGCQQNPRVAFVPGVNWSPVATSAPNQPTAQQVLTGYPLPSKPSRSAILIGYGWGLLPGAEKVSFQSGIVLAAAVGTPVLAAADGTIAFAGTQGNYGNLVVINHQQGLQTRYAQLKTINVKAGQIVKRGDTIATVGVSGRPTLREPHLRFEVRSRSELGWVAENPEPYLLR